MHYNYLCFIKPTEILELQFTQADRAGLNPNVGQTMSLNANPYKAGEGGSCSLL